MGLFSSKKKTHVYSSASRLMENEDIVNANQTAITDYLLRDTLLTDTTLKEMSIVDYMNQASSSNLPAKWRKVLQRAQSANYVYGIPTANLVLQESTHLEQFMEQIFRRTAMSTVTIIYAHVDEPNYYHMALQRLISDYDYRPEGNYLYINDVSYNIWDIQMRYPSSFLEDVVDEDLMTQWGYAATAGFAVGRNPDITRPHTPWVEDPDATEVVARVTLLDGTGYGEPWTLDVVLDGIDMTQDLIMACYLDGDQRKIFTGKFGTGEYPQIDSLFATGRDYGKFYPRMYARLNNKNLAEEDQKETEEYKNCQQVWRVTDLDWANWVEQLHENIEDAKDIAQSFVTCATPANTNDPLQIEYLYKWFDRLYETQARQRGKTEQDKYVERRIDFVNNNARDGLSLVIADKVYTQTLAFSHIGRVIHPGKLGEIGHYEMALEDVVSIVPGLYRREVVTKVHRYKHQITDNTYEVISVYGLSFSEQVRGGKSVTSVGDSESLLIPLDSTMYSEFSSRDYETIMAKSLHIIMNTVKVVKTKWYQRGAFQVVMFIVAVVIAVWTGGAGWGLVAVAKGLAVAVALSVVATIATKLLIKLGVSLEIVMVVAVIAAIATGYVNFSNTAQLAGMSAKTLMQISNVALKVQANMTQYEIASLMKQSQVLGEEHEQRMQEIQDLKDDVAMQSQLLNNALWVAPDFSGAYIQLGESAEDYYTRTIHAGNIGPAVIDISLGSVEQMLKLPSPLTTIQQFHGGN